MALGQAMILPPQPTFITVQLAPTYNILNTIAIIISLANDVDTNPGLDEWAVKVAAADRTTGLAQLVYCRLPPSRSFPASCHKWFRLRPKDSRIGFGNGHDADAGRSMVVY